MRFESPRAVCALALKGWATGTRPAVGLSKRCVELRKGCVSEYGQSPKRVLAETFQNKRRVARTETLKHLVHKQMSRRLATWKTDTSAKFGVAVQQSVIFADVMEKHSVPKSKVAWRPLSVCVERVLRDVRTASVPSVKSPSPVKSN